MGEIYKTNYVKDYKRFIKHLYSVNYPKEETNRVKSLLKKVLSSKDISEYFKNLIIFLRFIKKDFFVFEIFYDQIYVYFIRPRIYNSKLRLKFDILFVMLNFKYRKKVISKLIDEIVNIGNIEKVPDLFFGIVSKLEVKEVTLEEQVLFIKEVVRKTMDRNIMIMLGYLIVKNPKNVELIDEYYVRFVKQKVEGKLKYFIDIPEFKKILIEKYLKEKSLEKLIDNIDSLFLDFLQENKFVIEKKTGTLLNVLFEEKANLLYLLKEKELEIMEILQLLKEEQSKIKAIFENLRKIDYKIEKLYKILLILRGKNKFKGYLEERITIAKSAIRQLEYEITSLKEELEKLKIDKEIAENSLNKMIDEGVKSYKILELKDKVYKLKNKILSKKASIIDRKKSILKFKEDIRKSKEIYGKIEKLETAYSLDDLENIFSSKDNYDYLSYINIL